MLELAGKLENVNVEADFHVIDSNKTGRFYQNKYMDYKEVLEKLKVTKAVVEIAQSGQNGLTARALEAMFFKTKLITNNLAIKKCEFYKKENIFVIGDNQGELDEFLESSIVDIEEENIYPYSAQGWIENFEEE